MATKEPPESSSRCLATASLLSPFRVSLPTVAPSGSSDRLELAVGHFQAQLPLLSEVVATRPHGVCDVRGLVGWTVAVGEELC